jgi:hypothetical protein
MTEDELNDRARNEIPDNHLTQPLLSKGSGNKRKTKPQKFRDRSNGKWKSKKQLAADIEKFGVPRKSPI